MEQRGARRARAPRTRPGRRAGRGDRATIGCRRAGSRRDGRRADQLRARRRRVPRSPIRTGRRCGYTGRRHPRRRRWSLRRRTKRTEYSAKLVADPLGLARRSAPADDDARPERTRRRIRLFSVDDDAVLRWQRHDADLRNAVDRESDVNGPIGPAQLRELAGAVQGIDDPDAARVRVAARSSADSSERIGSSGNACFSSCQMHAFAP